MHEHQPPGRAAQDARGFDEAPLAEGQDLRPHHAGGVLPEQQRHRQDDVPEARAEKRHQDDDERQIRDAERHVGQAHQHGVEPPAVVSRDDPDAGADQRHEERRHEAHREGRPRPVDELRENVPPHVRGPQRIRAAGRAVGHQLVPADDRLLRIVRGEEGGAQRDQDEQRVDHDAGEREPVVLQDAPQGARGAAPAGPRLAGAREGADATASHTRPADPAKCRTDPPRGS